jgi:hypothetical protein
MRYSLAVLFEMEAKREFFANKPKRKESMIETMIGTVISNNGKKIRLKAERWSHIVETHDYMAGNQDFVFETLESLDSIIGAEKMNLLQLLMSALLFRHS